jgi:hypothetical protein
MQMQNQFWTRYGQYTAARYAARHKPKHEGGLSKELSF